MTGILGFIGLAIFVWLLNRIARAIERKIPLDKRAEHDNAVREARNDW